MASQRIHRRCFSSTAGVRAVGPGRTWRQGWPKTVGTRCLNWYGHNGSAALAEGQALTRSLLDVTTDIAVVAESLDRAPILVAHSMGGVPSLAYAATNPVTALVLLAPVLPAGFGADPIELAVDPTSMWMPPPGLIKRIWWAGVTDEESQRYTSLLVPESPRAVLEATRWLCEVNVSEVHVPALVIAAGADDLIPAEVQSLAQAIDATFVLLEDEGHGIPVNPVWAQVTAQISEWLSSTSQTHHGKTPPMASTQAVEFANFFADLSRRSSNPDFDLSTVRDIVETMHVATTEPEGVTYAEVDAGGVEALWCIPSDSDSEHVLLHNHMGGSVITSMHSDRKAAAHIAKAAGVRALVLNFRRSPEHKYPAQIEDVEAAFRWLLAQGYQPQNIASVGHSIGGYLAVNLAVRLRDRGAVLPGAILSISPWCDTTLSGKSIDDNADRDKLLSRGLLEFFRSCWLDGTGVDWSDPQVNLLNSDLSGLPPIAVFYGDDELLASEAVDFGHRAKAAGNDAHRERRTGWPAFLHHRCGPGARGRSRRSPRWAAGCVRRSGSSPPVA